MKKPLILSARLLLVVLIMVVGGMIGTYGSSATTALAACPSGSVEVSSVWGLSNPCFGGSSQNPIIDLIGYVIQYATGVFGLIFVLMIVIAGLQYVLSGASPDTAKSAKDRIRNAITGLVMMLLMFGILQLILPPGLGVFS